MKNPALPLALALFALGCATVEQVADPELVTMKTTLERGLVPAAQTSQMKALLQIEAIPPKLATHTPIHVALVLDTSGSMAGAAMKRAREAAAQLVEALHPVDRLTLVAFNTEAEVIVADETIGDADRNEILAHIQALEATGTTNVYGGLAKALEHLGPPSEDEVRRIVFLSDGRPNDPARARSAIASAANRQVAITSLGLGLDYDEALLASAARKTGGVFEFVDDPDQLAAVFEREVLRLDRVVAKHARLLVTPGPGIRVLRVEGHAPGIHDKTLSVALGDLAAGETREVVLSLEIDSRRNDVSIEMLDTVLHFDDAIGDAGHLERRSFVAAKTSLDEAAVDASVDPAVLASAVRARAGSTALDAIRMARSGQKADAIKMLEAAISTLKKDAKALKNEKVDEALRTLLELAESLPDLAQRAELDSAETSQRMRKVHSSAMSYTQ